MLKWLSAILAVLSLLLSLSTVQWSKRFEIIAFARDINGLSIGVERNGVISSVQYDYRKVIFDVDEGHREYIIGKDLTQNEGQLIELIEIHLKESRR